ncbi:ATP-binding protein [Hydrogenimonas thermophila]|uniref:AAA family ATPase n=1 Tax=Hydrogenimonas thermophila TaxID=223786 RepID=UPI002936DACF|nr:ATP-binding protein [Hydrogenimonas thermophila]WOE68825.1 ATP-binding protein [Hydrogenimonas thermophila]WOE71335.1 ATP-binding protein [Hydrogenimonas thermophila]
MASVRHIRRRKSNNRVGNLSSLIEVEEFESVRYLVSHIIKTFNLETKVVTEHGFNRDSIAEILELSHLEDKCYENRSEVIVSLKKRCNEILSEYEHIFYPKILEKNVKKIKSIINLNSVESDLLKFTVLLHYSQELDDVFDLMDDFNSTKLFKALSKILGYTSEEIKTVFSPKSILQSSGLVTLDRNNTLHLKRKIDLLSNSFADMMMTYEDEDIYELFKEAVRTCEKGSLCLDDYSYMQKELSIMLAYLKKSIKNRDKGVNILLYGPPGTGKTELVKAVAKELSLELFEVSYADEDDEPISGNRRLNAFKSAQYLFDKKPILLMFDEVEDIFDDDMPLSLFGVKPKQRNKGWMNRILENSKVPTIWISNSVNEIDNATIRRFDMVIEMPNPPKSKRIEIIQEHFGKSLKSNVIETIAEHPYVTPAILTRAAKVIEATKDENSDLQNSAIMLISSTLKAQGFSAVPKPKSSISNDYDPTLVNTKADLNEIAKGIVNQKSARLCLYGPPGTGKSAFGKWIATLLDAPLIIKKGSDLLSMWVGGTEKNIANAFEEAERENAVLVFDEVDSFLQDRREANRSWEITQVNELLTQMESFEGVFIATTNLMDNLDQASLRRFDLKLEFSYMTESQALMMFEKECKNLGINKPDKGVKKMLKELTLLTPGDFAAVKRQHRFNPISNATDLLERLMQECAVKEDAHKSVMGFL